jgi:hypothetical protein
MSAMIMLTIANIVALVSDHTRVTQLSNDPSIYITLWLQQRDANSGSPSGRPIQPR